jgi:branched-chain amino acid transport system permease protein
MRLADRSLDINKMIVIAVAFVLAATIPFYVPDAFVYLIGLTFLFIILAVSWDVMVGYTGQVNLGHTVFVGIGAYTAALLQVPSRFQGSSLEFLTSMPQPPIFISIIAGGVAAAIIGLGIGIITLRLKGYYFALVTAVLPLVFMQTTFVWSGIFGGEEGFSIGLERVLAETVVGRFYAAFIIMVISLAIMLYVVNSSLGLKFKAIREDQEAAEAAGIDTVKYKLVAFIISSFFGGIAGAAMIHYRITVSPDVYGIPLMLLIILATVIGGLGTIYGSIIGGFLIYLAKYWWLREIIDKVMQAVHLPINDEVILYIILIIIGVAMPGGVYQEIKKRIKR